ncbi:helix-turn-helix domain-containing protein [Kitasatospora sp. NA04385]|uniref:helix-turn-helix domain-containing protein n=1 Tax=Kitasatospora sp. NA04385 TaxID=2742135 RepID=UPI00158FEC79|nr:helix-turn-helix domain-containing protein [Kitasatospora sp. NA04385]QKW22556.1 helix-turn-helix domain-containing protein [Kitasatospora sp. NA04385]
MRLRPATGLELHDLDVPDPGLLPFAAGSFDAVGPLSRADFPHRHSFHELVYVAAGSGTHVIDLVEHRIQPPTLYAVLPGQVHRWSGAHRLDGWVLLFNEDFLHRHPEDLALVRALAAGPAIRPDRREHREMVGTLRELTSEHEAGLDGGLGVLQALLHVLLVRALRVARGRGPAAAPRAAGHPLATRFTRLIAESDRADRSVLALARELGVSTGYLHEVVKEATGRTPARLIREQQTLEAKRLLTTTDMTIRQVSAAAGFSDPAYFCRFFRREVGRTPGEFREKAS